MFKLANLGLLGKSFNRAEWALIRSGPRRLFSEQFIQEERAKLQQFRNIVRSILQLYIEQGIKVDLNG